MGIKISGLPLLDGAPKGTDTAPVVDTATRRATLAAIALTARSVALAATQTGTSPLTIGALYLPEGHLISAGSRALIGTVDGGTATLRLRSQSTAEVLVIWERTGALADVALGTPVTVAVADWYALELVGDAEPSVSLAFGLHLI